MNITRFLAAAVAAMTLAVSGCGTDPAKASDPVRLLVFGGPEELAAYRTLKAAYEEAFGGRHLQLIEAGDRADLLTRLSTSIAGGSPPDLFLMNYRFYGQFVAKGAVMPVGDRLAASKTLHASDFFPEPMAAFRWRGEQMCLPQNVSSLVVYYNRDAFARYSIPEPKPGWSWHDMVATAMALTRDVHGNMAKGAETETAPLPIAVYGLGIEPTMIRLAPFVWSNGGEIVDDDQTPTRFTLDTPKAREVLQAFLELRTIQGVIPTDTEVESEDDESRFVNGRLAMLLSSRRSTTTFRRIRGFDWDVAPLPVFGEPASILHSDAYCITAGARRPDDAWHFLEFALGPRGAAIMAATGRTVPSNISIARSPAFLDPNQKPSHAQVFLDAIPTLRATPAISTWPEIEDVTEGILENALYYGGDLNTVLRELDAKTRPLFARGVTAGG